MSHGAGAVSIRWDRELMDVVHYQMLKLGFPLFRLVEGETHQRGHTRLRMGNS